MNNNGWDACRLSFSLVTALDLAEGTFWAGVGEVVSERTFDLDGRRSLHGLLSAAGHSTAEDLVPFRACLIDCIPGV
jgi:hypothetical protein